jgi:hypothetical protein
MILIWRQGCNLLFFSQYSKALEICRESVRNENASRVDWHWVKKFVVCELFRNLKKGFYLLIAL